MADEKRVMHFTGIGGAGMSGLAEIMQQLGVTVRGSDLRLTSVTERLEKLGIEIMQGHAADNLRPDVTALVITSAVVDENPEVVEARRRGLSILLRGELLAELMRARRGVAIAGSHGKTTTSTMLADICMVAGLDPTVVIGGSVPALGGANARLGASDLLVCESDESDGSFLWLTPRYAAITNIDREHLDHYGSFDGVREAFVTFSSRVSWEGAIAVCIDDPGVAGILRWVRRRVLTYGHSERARMRILNPLAASHGISFELEFNRRNLGRFSSPILGEHNILNATAAITLALELKIDVEVVRSALAVFRGPGRRMELKGHVDGIRVIDDYGHHPSEIQATLKALRPTVAPGRLYVILQPHRYTRTRALIEEFATSFADADVLRIVDLYAASEQPIDGISAQSLVARIRTAGHPDVKYAGSVAEAANAAVRDLQPGDTVLTLGAGSITQAAGLIVSGLEKGDGHGETQDSGT